MHKFFVAVGVSLLLTGTAHAATIFQQTLTGFGLFADPNVATHEVTGLTGSRLDFTNRSTNRGALLSWDILGASSYNDLTVTVRIDHDALNGGDNDLFIGISDGTNVIAPTRIDGFSGAINTFDGTVGGTAANPTFLIDGTGNATHLTSLGGVDPVTFSALLPSDGSNATLLSAQEGTATAGSFTFDRALIPNNGLQLFLFGDGVDERYGINSLSVTVEEAEDQIAVPEPATLAVLALGLIALGSARLRRRT